MGTTNLTEIRQGPWRPFIITSSGTSSGNKVESENSMILIGLVVFRGEKNILRKDEERK